MNGIIEVLTMRRADGSYGLLGAVLREDDELLPQGRLKNVAELLSYQRLHWYERSSATFSPKQAVSVSAEDLESEITKKLLGKRLDGSDYWTVIHSGYVDDHRATDNAWMESTVFHLHLADRELLQELFGEGEEDEHAFTSILTGPIPRDHLAVELEWVTVDGPMEMMYGDHAELARKAKLKQMPLLKVSPLRETPLVSIKDDLLKQKMQLITGLMDEHYCRRLLISLWIDADRPSTSAAKYDPSAAGMPRNTIPNVRDGNYKEDFFKDRRNWSRWNLQMLVTDAADDADTTNMQTSIKTVPMPSKSGIEDLAKLQLCACHAHTCSWPSFSLASMLRMTRRQCLTISHRHPL